ncbi:conserved hypothetical protein [Candidatus Nitrotoga sp. BS]|uniref:GbsR/MarR family transcriptional regulator n=1 Tax=Candidatus Nitrotoga sp. BS TaxID=2890408 RepID=UPI001EF39FB3|nr:hypothetical protein [Candidatus Nitrotoga sp. BS]CAH1194506.1 conserved hypothetical protein [Candidatus Nitrotoga sp. BS]
MREILTNEENDFIDRLGLIAESGGLTRISGRIWGLLIVTGKAHAPIEIAEILQISRASISMALKTLQTLELVELKTKAGTRHTYFAMREHPYVSMLQAHSKQAKANTTVVTNAMKAIQRPEARKRLEDLETFYKIMDEGYLSMLSRLEQLERR